MRPPAVLQIDSLSVRLPDGSDRTHAIRDLSLTVEAGEILCIVGESGSGKSVAAQAVMGLLPQELAREDGRIRLLGEDIAGAPLKRLRQLRGPSMGMIFQEPMTALNPLMSVGRQIEEALAIHTAMTVRERKARALELMKEVRLPDVERLYSAYPHELSGGQRQRVMIAAALVLEPALLIADEPTTALDVTTQARILGLLRELQKKRELGVLFITHDFGVVSEIADRVAVMREGELVEIGAAARILSHPQHPYTRKLISAVPSYEPPTRTRRPDGPAVLQVTDLSKEYRKRSFLGRGRVTRALDAASLHLGKGETLGIVGESGSGKTTLARAVARLVEPTSGEVLVNGQDLVRAKGERLRLQRRSVQIVFQDPYRSLNPRRRVGDSIMESLLNFGTGKNAARQRARELISLVGLSEAALERYPHEFSGGQRQRICIARALAIQPDVLIADEALSALDVSVQAQIIDLLRDIVRRFDLSILFVTHDLRVAAQLCDRIVVMHQGVIVEEGGTEEILANPTHTYTQTLLASAPGRGQRFYSEHERQDAPVHYAEAGQ